MIHFTKIAILTIFLGACITPPQENQYLLGSWVCQYQNSVLQLPFPNAIHFVDDSIALWLKEDLQTCEAKWMAIEDYLTLDTAIYTIKQLNKEQLTLEINKEQFHYVKGKADLPKDPFDIKRYNWKKSETEGNGIALVNQYGLIEDTIWRQQSYYYQNAFIYRQSTPAVFKFDELNEHLFLIEALQHEDGELYKRRVRQIIDWTDNSFKTGKGHFQETEGFYQQSDLTQIENRFNRCKSGPLAFYQWVKTSYKGGKPLLEKHFFEQYQTVPNNESGFITIRFTINCHGQVGEFEIEQCDDEFEIIQFDKTIVNQLFKLTTELTEWKVGKNDENENVDSRFYVGFKIDSGKLIEVLP